MSIRSEGKLVDNVLKKVKEMNVDDRKDILELIFLLQNNEILKREKFGEYPINRISEALGIGAYSCDMEEDGSLFVDGTTNELYRYNQVIITKQSYSLRKQREIRANLLGVYLLDYLKNFDGNHQKVYIAHYAKTNMNNKAHFFASELLTPQDIFAKQYAIAAEHRSHPVFINAYLREYFNVTPDFVEKRICEIAYDYSLPFESTNPKIDGLNDNIIRFRRK